MVRLVFDDGYCRYSTFSWVFGERGMGMAAIAINGMNMDEKADTQIKSPTGEYCHKMAPYRYGLKCIMITPFAILTLCSFFNTLVQEISSISPLTLVSPYLPKISSVSDPR